MRRYNISFVLPMYNEAENIKGTILKLSEFAGNACGDYEIIVADDASTDNSAAIVASLTDRDSHIKLVRLARNTKFGGALNAGLKEASKDIVLYTDSDLPVRAEDMSKALDFLEGYDIVTGYSLVIKDASLKRILISKIYNFLVSFLFGLKIRDINSGFKIYRKEALKDMKLRSRSPFIDTEIFAEAAKRGCRIGQYGLVFELRTKGTSTIARPGVLLRSTWDMLAYKFSR